MRAAQDNFNTARNFVSASKWRVNCYAGASDCGGIPIHVAHQSKGNLSTIMLLYTAFGNATKMTREQLSKIQHLILNITK